MQPRDRTRALVLERTGEPPVLEVVDLLAPRAGEVAVAIHAAGVCHSDVSVTNGVLPQPMPCALGHEASGVVSAVGAGVTRWTPGDRVVIQWVPMCRTCASCVRGEPYLCTTYLRNAGRMDDGTTRFVRDGVELAHAMNAGAFADEIVVRETALAALPDDVPFEIGALIACGFLTGWGAAVNVAAVTPGEHVVVIGAGGVGISAAMGARAAGAASVTIVDPVEERRAHALEIGSATDAASPEDAERTVRARTGGRPDVVIEAVGRAAVQRAAFDLVRPGGRVVFAGANPGETIELPGYGFFLMAKRALGCWFGACDPERDVPRVVDAWRAGTLPIDRLITARRPLDEHAEAFEDLSRGRGIRTILIP
jgi:Zn-dependent alcohol dehydrogenase